VVGRHRPIYNDLDEEADAGDPILDPLYEEYGVDLVLVGHIHAYQRTYPVFNRTVASPPQTNFNLAVNPQAPIHIMQATAGAFIDGEWNKPYPNWLAYISQNYGFGVLTIHNYTTLQYQFYAMALNVESTLTVEDELWIQKSF